MKNTFILCLFIGILLSFDSCICKNSQSSVVSDSSDTFLAPKLLNSERIKLKFGNYHIKVLKKNAELRVSNLYSIKEDTNITRTFAVVHYPEIIDSAFLKEHKKIVAGGSIGSVFKQAQWKIKKESLFFGELKPSSDYQYIFQLMGNIAPSKLAIYTYRFTLNKEGKSYQYATISEVYHPDYLTLNQLKKIYQDADIFLDHTAVHQLLKDVENEMKTNYTQSKINDN